MLHGLSLACSGAAVPAAGTGCSVPGCLCLQRVERSSGCLAKGFFSLHSLWFGNAWEIVPKLPKLLKETVTVMPGCFILKGKKAISDHILITQKHENSQISFPS